MMTSKDASRGENGLAHYLQSEPSKTWSELAEELKVTPVRLMAQILIEYSYERAIQEFILRYLNGYFPDGWHEDEWLIAKLAGKLAGFHKLTSKEVDHVIDVLIAAPEGWKPMDASDPRLVRASSGLRRT